MADLPEGLDYNTMKLALAWEMVRACIKDKNEFVLVNPKERLALISNLLNQALDQIGKPPIPD